MNKEIIYRGLDNPRILGRPLFDDDEEPINTCPRHHKPDDANTDTAELEEPAITVEVLPTGEVVGKERKQLEKDLKPLRIRVDKFGNIERVD